MNAQHLYDPPRRKRIEMLRAARKLIAVCPVCATRRPLEPKNGHCWPCNNLTEVSWLAATDRQTVPCDKMCNDCAFRPDSPESQSDPEFAMENMHEGRIGNSEASPQCRLDKVVDQARAAGGIFWCHKPMLEPEQRYGFDVETQTLTPLYDDERWQACEGWRRVFQNAHGIKTTGNGGHG